MTIADDERITVFGLLLEAHAAVSAAVQRDLEADAGISGPEFGVLLRLLRTPGERLRMTGLAGCTGLSSSGMTRLIDRLERDGLVERTACPNDRRGFEAGLTDKGRALVVRALPAHVESIQRHLVDPLGGKVDGLERSLRVLRDSAARP
jgi:DNA-binding MarR family transcriptional regulator